MAINPGSDLISDALLAADPERAKAAAERLARLSAKDGQDGDAAPAFQAALASQSAAPTIAVAARPRQGTPKSGSPYQQFEVTVLKSLFELMLPQKATSSFGSGLAGDVWRSMLAQSLADVAGRAGIAGIAKSLEAREAKGHL